MIWLSELMARMQRAITAFSEDVNPSDYLNFGEAVVTECDDGINFEVKVPFSDKTWTAAIPGIPRDGYVTFVGTGKVFHYTFSSLDTVNRVDDDLVLEGVQGAIKAYKEGLKAAPVCDLSGKGCQ